MMPIKNNQKQANKKQKRETQCLQWDVPTFWVAQMVKNLPTVQEIQVQSLGQEDTLEKEMATYCSIFAWRTPWPEKPGGLLSMGLQRVDAIEQH